jgi:hypothetical protein
MFRFITQFMKTREPPLVLGRWGYHWESKLLHQKFYD